MLSRRRPPVFVKKKGQNQKIERIHIKEHIELVLVPLHCIVRKIPPVSPGSEVGDQNSRTNLYILFQNNVSIRNVEMKNTNKKT